MNGKSQKRQEQAQPLSPFSLAWITACFCISAWLGIRAGITSSIDFQWPGSHLLSLGLNPYIEALKDPVNPLFTASRWPNYAQSLYILMLPLGLLSLEKAKAFWALANAIFCLIAIYSLYHSLRPRPAEFALLAGLWLLSSPVRNVFTNGQTTLVVIAAIALGSSPSRWRQVTYGLAYLKYSFAPFLGTWMLFTQGRCAFARSLAIVILGATGFAAYFQDPMCIIQPLQVASLKADAWTSSGATWLAERQSLLSFLRILLLTLGAAISALICKRYNQADQPVQPEMKFIALAACVILSLIFSPHLYYDYAVTLIPAVVFSCRTRSKAESITFWVAILYIWFGYGRMYVLLGSSAAWGILLLANAIMLAVLLLPINRTSPLAIHKMTMGASGVAGTTRRP